MKMERGQKVKVLKVDGGAPDGLVGKIGEILSWSSDDVLVRFDAEDLPRDAGLFRDWNFELDDIGPM